MRTVMNDLHGPAAWPTWFIGRSESPYSAALDPNGRTGLTIAATVSGIQASE
jgi:hypothetical protein